MEEIIKQTFAAIPQYLVNFSRILSSPRQFPLEQLPKDEQGVKQSLADALKFILISYALILILNALKSNSENVFKEMGATAVLILIQMCLLVFPIFLSWKIFGSKKPFLDYLIIYSYHFGVIFIIITLMSLISDGYLKTFDRPLYHEIIKVKSNPALFKAEWLSNGTYQVALGILVFGFALSILWSMIGWGSYRMLNNAQKMRSFGVLLISGIFTWIALVISFLITNAIK